MKEYDIRNKQCRMLRRGILCGLALAACPASMTMALPQGGVVAGGSGSISSAGSTMNVAQQTQNLFVNWNSFSINKGEKVQFTGPQDFSVLNRVVGHDESKIYGELNASNRGRVYLINPNGILIGDGAIINVGSFVASTKDVLDVPSFIASGKVNFQGDAQGNIVNLGAIKADRIEMHGDTISLKAANVNKNFDAPQILIDANVVHAGVRNGETTAAVDGKLGVTSEAFQLKDTMRELREAVGNDTNGKYMLAQDDLTPETWSGGSYTLSGPGAVDGLGYAVGNKTIKDMWDGTGIFNYISGEARVDNFTFDNITVTERSRGGNTGTLAGWLDGDGVRVANVTVKNGSVTGYGNVGGLIGSSDVFRRGNTFLNVHNVNTSVTGLVVKSDFGDVTGENIGGIIGGEWGWRNNGGQNVFRNVSNSGTITGRQHVGGIAGHLVCADMDQVRNTGRIEQRTAGELIHSQWGDYIKYAASDFIGGIAGSIGPKDSYEPIYEANGVRIRNAYNGGTIGADTSKDDYYDGGSYIGGIVGMISGYNETTGDFYGAADTVIEYAHNTGTITAGRDNVGGIVGYAAGLGKDNGGSASDMIIRHSYNDGTINAKYSGGIAGTFGGTIEQCYNNGALGEYSGGLVARTESGLNNDIVIRDSYNTKNGTAHVGGIIGVDYTAGTTTLERVWNEADIKANQNYSGGIIGDAQNCGSIIMNQVYNFGKVYGDGGIGGLIGHNQVDTDASVTINSSANYGDIIGGEHGEIGGFIGGSTTCGNNNTFINDSANFGNISGTDNVGGFIGYYHQLDSGELSINNSYNYGTVTADDGKTAGGMIGYVSWGEVLSQLNAVKFTSSGTVGDTAVGIVEYRDETGWKEEFVGNFEATTNLTDVPDKAAYANKQFLSWKNTTKLDSAGELGTETGGYPDGGYVWKMYETDQKDGEGNTLYRKPLLTAFLTKAETQKNSVEANAADMSGALYDVTMPDGQQIKGIAWQQMLELQNQFTLVNNRGKGSADPAYTASDTETNGRIPGNLYGYYNFSQQGLNIFITPGTVKPKEPSAPAKPIRPVIPVRHTSRNDYLYSDGHDTGDGELHWYMHMPPLIYVKDTGVKTRDLKY